MSMPYNKSTASRHIFSIYIVMLYNLRRVMTFRKPKPDPLIPIKKLSASFTPCKPEMIFMTPASTPPMGKSKATMIWPIDVPGCGRVIVPSIFATCKIHGQATGVGP